MDLRPYSHFRLGGNTTVFGAAGVDALQGGGEGSLRVDESVVFPDKDMVAAAAASRRVESVCPMIVVVMAAAFTSRI